MVLQYKRDIKRLLSALDDVILDVAIERVFERQGGFAQEFSMALRCKDLAVGSTERDEDKSCRLD